MPKPPERTFEFAALVDVVKSLRGPDGCPWDKEQTHKSLTQYAIEEAHELAEAIDHNDEKGLVEELGDVLFQVVLHAEIGRQENKFTLEDVIRGITEKMIRRHPHVFSDVKVENSREVLSNWSKIKELEKAKSQSAGATNQSTDSTTKTTSTNLLENPFANIPTNLPALLRSQKIGDKTVRFKFDWDGPWQVMDKIDEELNELKEALKEKSVEEQQLELGDLLFSVVQLARHIGFDAEQALRMSNIKFEGRFLKVRELIEKDGKIISELSTKELENYWAKAKLDLKNTAISK